MKNFEVKSNQIEIVIFFNIYFLNIEYFAQWRQLLLEIAILRFQPLFTQFPSLSPVVNILSFSGYGYKIF